jgi:hypothetical protein
MVPIDRADSLGDAAHVFSPDIPASPDNLVRELFEALSQLCFAVDDVGRSQYAAKPPPMPTAKALEQSRAARATCDRAVSYLEASGYKWDGRRFER